jgi:hypothetical protein
MDETLAAIGGVQLTVAGIAIGILFDFNFAAYSFALLSVIAGSYIVAKQVLAAR